MCKWLSVPRRQRVLTYLLLRYLYVYACIQFNTRDPYSSNCLPYIQRSWRRWVELRSGLWLLTYDFWLVTFDLWLLTCDFWLVTFDFIFFLDAQILFLFEVQAWTKISQNTNWVKWRVASLLLFALRCFLSVKKIADTFFFKPALPLVGKPYKWS